MTWSFEGILIAFLDLWTDSKPTAYIFIDLRSVVQNANKDPSSICTADALNAVNIYSLLQ